MKYETDETYFIHPTFIWLKSLNLQGAAPDSVFVVLCCSLKVKR